MPLETGFLFFCQQCKLFETSFWHQIYGRCLLSFNAAILRLKRCCKTFQKQSLFLKIWPRLMAEPCAVFQQDIIPWAAVCCAGQSRSLSLIFNSSLSLHVSHSSVKCWSSSPLPSDFLPPPPPLIWGGHDSRAGWRHWRWAVAALNSPWPLTCEASQHWVLICLKQALSSALYFFCLSQSRRAEEAIVVWIY